MKGSFFFVFVFLFFSLSLLFGESPVFLYQFALAQVKEVKGVDLKFKELGLEKGEEGAIVFEDKNFLLKLFRFELSFDLPRIQENYEVLGKPWIVVTMGNKATLKMEKEEFLGRAGWTVTGGFALEVTPVQVDEKRGVLTEIDVGVPPSSLKTKLWLREDAFTPLFSCELKTKESRKKLAVFAKVVVLKELPKEKVVVMGDLRGFEEFAPSVEAEKEKSSIAVSSLPDLELNVWLTGKLRISVSSDWAFLGAKISKEGLMVGAILVYDGEIGVGLFDKSDLSSGTLSGGAWILIDARSWSFSGLLFMGRVEIGSRRLYLDFSFACKLGGNGNSQKAILRVGYRVNEYLVVFTGVALGTDSTRAIVGFRIEF